MKKNNTIFSFVILFILIAFPKLKQSLTNPPGPLNIAIAHAAYNFINTELVWMLRHHRVRFPQEPLPMPIRFIRLMPMAILVK
jgi:hypothetical protein